MLMKLDMLDTNDHYVVGLSGGKDSISLVHYLKNNTEIKFKAIYVNHNINENSNKWGDFCNDFCNDFDIPYEMVDVDLKNSGSNNLENAAREERYKAFKRFGNKIIVAHHRKDQHETFFLKLMRGSGIRGLVCMGYQSTNNGLEIYRPMLDVTKVEIDQYYEEHGLSHIEDPSNNDTVYDRNFLRNIAFPLMVSKFPNFHKSLSRSIELIKESEILLDELAKIDEGNVTVSHGKWDVSKVSAMTPIRLKNLITMYVKREGGIVQSSGILENFVKSIQMNNFNARTTASFGRITFTQKGKHLLIIGGNNGRKV